MTVAPPDDLEARYLAEVRRHLTDVPRRIRRELVDLAASNLAERPASPSWDELVGALGSPDAYAATLRSERGLPPAVGPLRRAAIAPWTTKAVVLGVVAIVVALAVWQRDEGTADAAIQNSCSGVAADDPAVTVTVLEAAGVRERRVSYADGAEVGVGLCLTSKPGVDVLDVDLGTPSRSLFEQTGVRVRPWNDEPEDHGRVLDSPTRVPASGLWVTIDGRLTDCEWYSPGGGVGFDRAAVRYRYRGHERITEVALIETVTFEAPPEGECPRSREGG